MMGKLKVKFLLNFCRQPVDVLRRLKVHWTLHEDYESIYSRLASTLYYFIFSSSIGAELSRAEQERILIMLVALLVKLKIWKTERKRKKKEQIYVGKAYRRMYASS